MVSLVGSMMIGAGAAGTQDIHHKSFDYPLDGAKYRITISGFDDYSRVGNVSDALALVRDDDSASVLLEGQYTANEFVAIGEMLEQIYDVNPRLISTTEPIIMRLEDAEAGLSVSNWKRTVEEFDAILREYGGNKTLFRELDRDYSDQLDSLSRGIVWIPWNAKLFRKFREDKR